MREGRWKGGGGRKEREWGGGGEKEGQRKLPQVHDTHHQKLMQLREGGWKEGKSVVGGGGGLRRKEIERGG